MDHIGWQWRYKGITVYMLVISCCEHLSRPMFAIGRGRWKYNRLLMIMIISIVFDILLNHLICYIFLGKRLHFVIINRANVFM